MFRTSYVVIEELPVVHWDVYRGITVLVSVKRLYISKYSNLLFGLTG